MASETFQPPGGGSTKRPFPVQDRVAHAGRLRGDLATLRSTIARTTELQTEMGVPAARRGQVVAATGRVGNDINVGSGRVDSRTRAVFTVQRRRPQSQRSRDQATFFVTDRALEGMLDRLDKYEDWDDEQPGDRRPTDFWFFESIESLRAATLEDFWNDVYANFPRGGASAEWEVWTRRSLDEAFTRSLAQLDLETRGGVTSFVDTEVRNVVATPRQLRRLIAASAAVVELRGASAFEAGDGEPTTRNRSASIDDLAERIRPAGPDAPLVTLLDTGVNRAHPLLADSLPASRCHTASSDWDRFDADGHGTKMAGIALFGDLREVMEDDRRFNARIGLESVVVSSPGSATRLPARDALARAVNLVEALPRRRIYCLAATARGEAEDGRPTSTSSKLDQLAFGDGTTTRLICAAVGNVPTDPLSPYEVSQYAQLNEDHGVQSPAQALNALSVGAATLKCSASTLVAPNGDLSPTSRTAQAWEVAHPHKPDIVMEGGNHIVDPSGTTSRPHGPDWVLTTSRDVARRPLTVTGETSAATAAAARLAALVAARYPEMRAETIRGLLVHSAVWTDAMLERHAKLLENDVNEQEAWARLLGCYGWGIPDEERLFWSAENALTLVVEDTLRPYQLTDSGVTLREMKYFRLPWPDGALSALGNTEVEMRATLSYFVAPDPTNASRDRLDRYPSHRLKFGFQRFGESEEQAQSRFNRAVAGDGEGGDDTGWLLGSRVKARGTIHQDVWRGPAYMLEERNGVSVAPIRGWWGDRRGSHPEDETVHFSLIVSVRTPEVETELYSEALARVPVEALVTVA